MSGVISAYSFKVDFWGELFGFQLWEKGCYLGVILPGSCQGFCPSCHTGFVGKSSLLLRFPWRIGIISPLNACGIHHWSRLGLEFFFVGRFLIMYSISVNAHRADIGNLSSLFSKQSGWRYPFYSSFLLVLLCFSLQGFLLSMPLLFTLTLFIYFFSLTLGLSILEWISLIWDLSF